MTGSQDSLSVCLASQGPLPVLPGQVVENAILKWTCAFQGRTPLSSPSVAPHPPAATSSAQNSNSA